VDGTKTILPRTEGLLEDIELEIEALNLALQLGVDHAEAILRTELGSAVSKMTSKELRRDLMLLAKNNPALFISTSIFGYFFSTLVTSILLFRVVGRYRWAMCLIIGLIVTGLLYFIFRFAVYVPFPKGLVWDL